MNAREMLLAEFHRLAEVPEAVPRLRRFVLDLAVRGNLGPGAIPATPQSNPEAARDSEPFAIPPQWTWRPLEAIADCGAGQKVPAATLDEGAWTLDLEDIDGETGRVVAERTVADRPALSTKAAFEAGDVLYGKLRPYLNKVIVAQRPGYCTTEIVPVRPGASLDAFFLRVVMRSPYFLAYAARLNYGMKMPRLGTKDLKSALIPLPPLHEQRRIVAKVDELMALCDRLEAAQRATAEQRDQLSAMALHGLNDGNGDAARRERGRFYLGLMPRLSTSSAHLGGLRHAALRLAVEGGLVAQDPADEPATAALAAGDRARAAVAARDRRASAQSQSPLAEELRWKVPESWEWRPLADLVLFIDYRGKTPRKTRSGIRLITAKNVRRACINTRPEEFIDECEYESWMRRGLPQDGDVLFTTEAPMGNAAVLRVTERVALAQRVICLRGYGAVDPAFLVLQLLSPPFQAILSATATGLTAKGIKAAKLKRLPIAVPPRTEQLRIVARVAELLDTCDRLEEQAASCRAQGFALFEAVLQRALADAS